MNGKILQIIGPVVDVEFEEGIKLPQLFNALKVKNGDKEIVLEVVKHLDLTKKMLMEDSIGVKKQIIIDICNASRIDAKILHEIYCNPQHESIFICAGNMHIYQICKILPDLGFNFIRNIGTSWDEEAVAPKAFEVNVGKYFEDFYFSTQHVTKTFTMDGLEELEVESSGRGDGMEAPPVKRSKKESVLN